MSWKVYMQEDFIFMSRFSFRLAPAYCLYNGVCIMNQNGPRITFLMENAENTMLKEHIRSAFLNYVEYVKMQKDCPSLFRTVPEVYFKKGCRKQLKEIIMEENFDYEEERL